MLSAGKRVVRPAMRGSRASRGSGEATKRRTDLRCALAAQSASGLRDARRPALEPCGSPGSVGAVRRRAPCFCEDALLGADRSRRRTTWRRRRPRCPRRACRSSLRGSGPAFVRVGVPRLRAASLFRRALVSAKACVHAVCDASRASTLIELSPRGAPALAAWIGHARLSSGGRD